MESTVNQILQQAIASHKEGKIDEAEKSYKKAIELKPDYAEAHYNLGVMLQNLGRFDEAEKSYKKAIELKPDFPEAYNNLGATLLKLSKIEEAEKSYKKAIELKPDYAEAHYNLGVMLQNLGRFDEAEKSYKKAIELKPDYAEAHYNLGNTLKKVGRFDEAEISFKKAIELKPDFPEAHNNLGATLLELGKIDEAEASLKKAIELKPDYADAHNNLDILLKGKDLLVNIFETRKSMKKNKVSSIDSGMRLTSNPFITHRNVETKHLKDLYKGKFKELDKTEKKDARYGNGRCSDFKFFKNDFPIVKNIEADLINIMKQAVKSDIYIFDSFLNIYGAGSGTTPHDHTRNFDKTQGLVNQKYSLTYYLSLGDQNCSEPGNLQLYSPSEEIRLSEGMVIIIPADRKHCAVYNGEKDRIMIGINFYSLL
jgi:Flp pilus assembly protein TadD